MITRLEVDGFKSLREFAVDLEPLTVFVGPNGAGKSNLLEALGLLGRLASMSLEEAFRLGRGRIADQFSRAGGEAGRTIRFAVEVSLRGPFEALGNGASALPDRYRYELVIERRARPSGTEELAVADEHLCVLCDSKDSKDPVRQKTIFRQEERNPRERRVSIAPDVEGRAENSFRCPHTHSALGSRFANAERFYLQFGLDEETRARMARLRELIDTQTDHSLLKQVPLLKQVLDIEDQRLGIDTSKTRETGWSAVITTLGDALSHFRLLQLDAARLREPSERVASDVLAPDASNLPTILADLPGPTLGEIRADLVSLIPGLAGFDVVPDEDSLRVEFKLSGGDRLPARLASDGTLRALALLTALHVEPRPSVIGIEEPENGIYPGRLRMLLSLLRELAAPNHEASPGSAPQATQLLLTSHSPIVLAAFRDTPEHLRFMDLVRRDGQLATRARAVGELKEPGDGARIVSLREVDALLHAAAGEAAE
ncbi:AAA family ATPase [Sorangium sp. So ce1153]|uniref:AAA family ATPase n=1 Tax=Sorangium sp. So ce1153 TaxID=3133333 RepID=UPI003F61AC44